MTVLPNIGITLPTRGAPGAGLWDDTQDANSALIDAHNHTTGRGLPITSAAITVDADISFGSLWAPTNLQRIQFASVEPLSGNNKSLFVADGTGGSTAGELYWRSNAGSNVKLTSGASLNVAAFTGGIGGDYASVGAAVAFDDSGDRYTFKQQSPGNWARLASGDLRLFETGTTESVFVGLAAPSALASSYTITLPLAAPGTTAIAQVDSSGVVTTSNTIVNDVTMTANKHVTVSGTGEFKHGDRTMVISGTDCKAITNVSYATLAGTISSTGAATIVCSIPLHVGDRIKSVSVAMIGDNSVDATITVFALAAFAAASTIGTSAISNVSSSGQLSTIDVTDTTITSTKSIAVEIDVGANALSILHISCVYDHP